MPNNVEGGPGVPDRREQQQSVAIESCSQRRDAQDENLRLKYSEPRSRTAIRPRRPWKCRSCGLSELAAFARWVSTMTPPTPWKRAGRWAYKPIRLPVGLSWCGQRPDGGTFNVSRLTSARPQTPKSQAHLRGGIWPATQWRSQLPSAPAVVSTLKQVLPRV